MYSGELDVPFNVRILGIDNLENLFMQIDEKYLNYDEVATYNGFLEPSYITKTIQSLPREEGEKKKKKEKAFDRHLNPKLKKVFLP